MDCIIHGCGFVCRGQVGELLPFLQTLSEEKITIQELLLRHIGYSPASPK